MKHKTCKWFGILVGLVLSLCMVLGSINGKKWQDSRLNQTGSEESEEE